MKSASPALAASLPEASYTQCRGNVLAPSSSNSLVPSAWIVSDSVDHTVGASNLTNGGLLTRRGAGTAVWPPTVCTNVADVSVELDRHAGCRRSDGGEARLLAAHGDGGGAHQTATAVAGVDDPSAVELDPSDEVVGEPEPVGVPQRLEVVGSRRAADRRSG